MSIFSMVSAGVLVGHLFGMRLLEATLPKLGTDQESRRALGILMADIRSAKILRIGNGNLGSFKRSPETPSSGKCDPDVSFHRY